MNSKAAQLRENGTEIVRLVARFALAASFLSAGADRFGFWGPYGARTYPETKTPARCASACPNDAITHGHGFEVASFNTATLVMRKEQMLAPIPEGAKPPVIAAPSAAAH